METAKIKFEVNIDNSKFKKQLRKLKWNLFWLRAKVWLYKKLGLIKNENGMPLHIYLSSIYPYRVSDMHQLVEDCKIIKGSIPTRKECKQIIELSMGNKMAFSSAAAQFYAR